MVFLRQARVKDLAEDLETTSGTGASAADDGGLAEAVVALAAMTGERDELAARLEAVLAAPEAAAANGAGGVAGPVSDSDLAARLAAAEAEVAGLTEERNKLQAEVWRRSVRGMYVACVVQEGGGCLAV